MGPAPQRGGRLVPQVPTDGRMNEARFFTFARDLTSPPPERARPRCVSERGLCWGKQTQGACSSISIQIQVELSKLAMEGGGAADDLSCEGVIRGVAAVLSGVNIWQRARERWHRMGGPQHVGNPSRRK